MNGYNLIFKDFFNTAVFRWAELIILFIGLPLLYYFDKIPFHKAIPLLIVFFLLLFIILRDKKFDRRYMGFNTFHGWKPLLLRFIILAVTSVIIVRVISPENWFFLPRERFLLWLIIMVFYPLWSAFPQEFIFRTWFFHRYRDLISNETGFFLVNAALFSFSHIIFRNWLAIVLTFLGGLMFAYTYRKSRSLPVVFTEHMLYGNLIFTVGIGQYFYLPLSN